MTSSRLLILLGVLLLGFGTVYILPRSPEIRPASISLDLPDQVGEWYGVEQDITERELEILPSDTKFARTVYTNPFGDSIFVSVVLSGEDMNNSIHRPERCLPAQGWSLLGSQEKTIKLPAEPPRYLPVTRLYNGRIIDKDGEKLNVFNLNYYWFVGHQRLASNHLQRVYLDAADRVLKGYNERWAYVTVAATITDKLQQFGRTQEETDRMLRDFIRELFPKIEDLPPAPSTI